VKLTIHLHLVQRSENEWSYTSTPQYVFMAWYLVKHGDNFTFTWVVTPCSVVEGYQLSEVHAAVQRRG
jgi:hypothetical protein